MAKENNMDMNDIDDTLEIINHQDVEATYGKQEPVVGGSGEGLRDFVDDEEDMIDAPDPEWEDDYDFGSVDGGV